MPCHTDKNWIHSAGIITDPTAGGEYKEMLLTKAQVGVSYYYLGKGGNVGTTGGHRPEGKKR